MNRGTKGDGAVYRSASPSYARTRSRPQGSDDSNAEQLNKLEALFRNGPRTMQEGSPLGRSAPVGAPRSVFANARKSSGRSPSERRMRLERLRIAREPAAIAEAADAFLQHHQLPDDLEILYKLLHHPSEKVLRDAMGEIYSLLEQGRVDNTVLLDARLTDVAARIREEATEHFVAGLRHKLEQLRAEQPSFAGLQPVPTL